MSLVRPLVAAGADERRPAVVVAVQAGYHVEELAPAARVLHARGVPTVLVLPEPPRRPLRRVRPSWRRRAETLRAAAGVGLRPARATVPAADLLAGASVVVVTNDWGATTPLLDAADAAGVPVAAKVEGVQDFRDLHASVPKRPYRRADRVLCIGRSDAVHLPGVDTVVVGSVRLEAAWTGPPTRADGPVVVNSNFTYGVLTAHRRPWMASVRAAAGAAGVETVVSRHLAERGLADRRTVSAEPVSVLLGRAPQVVTRFSTLVLEALCLGVEVCYHNPHGERLVDYLDPRGAFDVTSTTDGLAAALARRPPPPAEVRGGANEFLADHVDVNPAQPAAERTADAIVDLAGLT